MKRMALMLLACFSLTAAMMGQSLPASQAESVRGTSVNGSELLRGRSGVLIMSFSRQAGPESDRWAAALAADPALRGLPVVRAAMLESAPGFVRSLIRSQLRRQLSAADQDAYFLFRSGESAWRAWFHVTDDKQPYIALLSGNGVVLWKSHGAAASQEAELRSRLASR